MPLQLREAGEQVPHQEGGIKITRSCHPRNRQDGAVRCPTSLCLPSAQISQHLEDKGCICVGRYTRPGLLDSGCSITTTSAPPEKRPASPTKSHTAR